MYNYILLVVVVMTIWMNVGEEIFCIVYGTKTFSIIKFVLVILNKAFIIQ